MRSIYPHSYEKLFSKVSHNSIRLSVHIQTLEKGGYRPASERRLGAAHCQVQLVPARSTVPPLQPQLSQLVKLVEHLGKHNWEKAEMSDWHRSKGKMREKQPRNSRVRKGEGGGAPGAGAEIHLRTMEETMVEQVFISLQPTERTMTEQIFTQ